MYVGPPGVAIRNSVPSFTKGLPPTPLVLIEDELEWKASVEAASQCLEATGLGPWEALGQVVVALGQSAATTAIFRARREGLATHECVRGLNDVARVAPDFANAMLQDWLAGAHLAGDLWLSGLGWVQVLPNGLQVDGDLNLVGCGALTTLGTDLRVGGSLGLLNCRSLTQLPCRLWVGGELDARGCEHLAVLPDDLIVLGDLWTWPNVETPVGIMVGGRTHKG